MKSVIVTLIGCLMLVIASTANADVYVKGYFRKDGTYVQPHIRSNQNNVKWDNYGRSTNDSQRMNPYTRDSDKDGTPNYLDLDDNNDGWIDDYQ